MFKGEWVDGILSVIDHLLKTPTFTTVSSEITAKGTVEVVYERVMCEYGMPQYETDRVEPIILEEAMEKALDNELWLQDVSSRKGQWGWRNMPTPTALEPINPTGPAPMELCGFSAPHRPTGLPPHHPTIPQAVKTNLSQTVSNIKTVSKITISIKHF
uniref:Uncharacterized protein n=1 Tax=Chromera velia CCMP2878 TaxID=1169474 RepID=A0A0G4HT00_9ALVE|eukprot:Cvel_31202.t1-p1 / transcript=Cvel_31202.t1 / gene=Cvel_31202 / organism=Chromera_velia_CCMP2878 / gene_product=hypothetical protein / transcript_product=hypothetical protein / location=Cvel_scaffold4607:1106-4440(-) / protein_length=157 / sequence_SO=supercontig / SO=protein_coding / is_pseudo=false